MWIVHLPTRQVLPLGKEVQPTLLDKEDELRRLSELQKRDSLVRGLGIPEILHCMFLDSGTKTNSEEAYVSEVRMYVYVTVLYCVYGAVLYCVYVTVLYCVYGAVLYCSSAHFALCSSGLTTRVF